MVMLSFWWKKGTNVIQMHSKDTNTWTIRLLGCSVLQWVGFVRQVAPFLGKKNPKKFPHGIGLGSYRSVMERGSIASDFRVDRAKFGAQKSKPEIADRQRLSIAPLNRNASLLSLVSEIARFLGSAMGIAI